MRLFAQRVEYGRQKCCPWNAPSHTSNSSSTETAIVNNARRHTTERLFARTHTHTVARSSNESQRGAEFPSDSSLSFGHSFMSLSPSHLSHYRIRFVRYKNCVQHHSEQYTNKTKSQTTAIINAYFFLVFPFVRQILFRHNRSCFV